MLLTNTLQLSQYNGHACRDGISPLTLPGPKLRKLRNDDDVVLLYLAEPTNLLDLRQIPASLSVEPLLTDSDKSAQTG